MDLLTRSDLESIADPGPDGTYISLFMPTHRVGSGIEADKIRWKNLVTSVEDVLLKKMRRTEAEAILAPAKELLHDAMFWQYLSDGLAMFLRPDWNQTYRVPAPMPTLATIGEKNVLGPLLRLLSGDGYFLLLALSQQEIRLMEGSRNTVEQVELVDVPTSLREVVEAQEPRSDTITRPSSRGGAGSRAVFYGHGAGDAYLKKTEVEKFVRGVSKGLRDVLSSQSAPMVLVGLENLVVPFKETSSYPNILPDVVDRNADDLSAEALHEHAWPIVEKKLRDDRAAIIDRYRSLTTTGRVSSDLETVLEAAQQGRVETLFVESDPWCWERAVSDPMPVVELGKDPRFADCEQVDAAAVATLKNRGDVYATSKSVAPDREVAAIFRY